MIPTKLKIPQYTVVATRNGNPFLVGPVTVSRLLFDFKTDKTTQYISAMVMEFGYLE